MRWWPKRRVAAGYHEPLDLKMNNEALKNRWKKFQQAKHYLIFTVFLMGAVTVITSFENIYEVTSPIITAIFLLLIFAVGLPIGFYTMFWKCPKCNKSYSIDLGSNFTIWNPWVKQCRSCGLPFGETDFEKTYKTPKSKISECPYSHLPEDSPTGICKWCGKDLTI